MADISVILKLKDQLSNGMAQAMGNSERSVKLLDTSMKGMTRTFANIGTVLAGGWIGQKVLAGIDKFSKAAAESEIVVAKLNVALGGNTEALVEQANQLSAKLGIDDEAIIRMQSMLGGYTKNKQAIQDLTPAILDMAEALGMDMDTAAKLVGKALRNDNDELAKYKIHVEGAAGSQERATSITKALGAAFGGQAQAANDASDKSKNVAVAMGNVSEAIGEQILPEVRELNATLAAFANDTLVPLGKIISHALVDPFRFAAIGAMGIAQGILWAYNASNKLMIHLQKEGTPIWKQYKQDIAETTHMIAALDDEITTVTKSVMGIKEPAKIGGVLPGFDEGGTKKKVKPEEEADLSAIYDKATKEARDHDRQMLDDRKRFIDEEADAYIKQVEQRDLDAAELKAIDEEITKTKIELLEMRIAQDEKEAESAKKLAMDRVNFSMEAAGMTVEVMKSLAQASKANGETMKAIAIAEIGVNAASAGVAATAKIWSSSSSWQEALVESIIIDGLIVAQAALAISQASKQSYSTGTMYAPGGVARVHQDETIFLPRGSRVETAAQSRGGGSFAININGNVTQETMPSLRSELRTFARTMERATRGGYIDQKRLARYAA